jgi:hypothetical protein
MLSAADFRREQDYFVEKLKLRNRCLHGWGVACGLEVTALDRTDAYYGDGQAPVVRVRPGVAVDPAGNEIVVPRPAPVDLWRQLSSADRAGFTDGGTLYLSIEYRRTPADLTRGVHPEGCSGDTDCDYGSWLDGWCLVVTAEAPETGGCADPCCESGCDGPVLLAAVQNVYPDRIVEQGSVHMEVRRPLTRYRMTTITGVNWVHGGSYPRDAANALLGFDVEGGGLAVAFSGEVHTGSLVDGVVEVQVVQGGGGPSANTWYVRGDLATGEGPYADWVRFRQNEDETLQRGDRVVITVRTPFILDRCCRPVDGAHVGGRVPLIPGTAQKPLSYDFCTTPPPGIGPWTSGTGTGAGNFESWFFVEEKK